LAGDRVVVRVERSGGRAPLFPLARILLENDRGRGAVDDVGDGRQAEQRVDGGSRQGGGELRHLGRGYARGRRAVGVVVGAGVLLAGQGRQEVARARAAVRVQLDVGQRDIIRTGEAIRVTCAADPVAAQGVRGAVENRRGYVRGHRDILRRLIVAEAQVVA